MYLYASPGSKARASAVFHGTPGPGPARGDVRSGALRKAMIALGAPPEKVDVIPNGVRTELFYTRSREQALIEMSDADLARLFAQSQPSEMSPEAGYAP